MGLSGAFSHYNGNYQVLSVILTKSRINNLMHDILYNTENIAHLQSCVSCTVALLRLCYTNRIPRFGNLPEHLSEKTQIKHCQVESRPSILRLHLN
jgi:hypothetical protein